MYVNASGRQSARCLDVLSFLPFGIMRSYPGFCRRKQLEYNPGLTHRRRAGHPRANRRTSDRPSFCGVRPSCSRVIMSCHIFQSTHPLQGATWSTRWPISSIRHFNPRTPCGVRRPGKTPSSIHQYFNPRTPCGVRRILPRSRCSTDGFQSTHPLRGATLEVSEALRLECISIHAPLAGCDPEAARPA